MGYGEAMIRELEQTLNAAEVEAVVVGTPIDLGRFLSQNKPTHRARYEVQELGRPTLEEILVNRFSGRPAPLCRAPGEDQQRLPLALGAGG
jgi:predicted GTPase